MFVAPEAFDPGNGLDTVQTPTGPMQTFERTVTTQPVSTSGAPSGQATQRKVKQTVRPSLYSRESYINYRGDGGHNDYAPFTVGAEEVSQVSPSSLISWSKKHPGLQLRPHDFAYLKNLNVYPVNRMVVLRRFPGVAQDDLLDWTGGPASSTVVGFLKPDDDSPFQINFAEEWEPSVKKGLIDVINDIIGIKESSGKLPTFEGSSNLEQSIMTNLGNALGITTSTRNPLGNPNIIHEAAIRKTNYEGLRSGFTITVNTEYEYKYIGGIDGHVAMLDLLSNCVRMGTSDAQFVVNGEGGFAKTASKIVTLLKAGDLATLGVMLIQGLKSALSSVQKEITGYLRERAEDVKERTEKQLDAERAALENQGREISAVDKVEAIGTAVVQEGREEASRAINGFIKTAGKLISTTIYKYEWPLKGAMAAMSGTYSAPWHVSMGNPKAPWLSIGNLIISDVQIDIGNTLAFDDTPSSFKVKFVLKPGRNLGGQEIMRMFNVGKGRTYMEVNEGIRKLDGAAAVPASSAVKKKPASKAAAKAKSATQKLRSTKPAPGGKKKGK
jgi:hypothetical protein